MEPPPAPPLSAAPPLPSPHFPYSDSLNSSPNSRNSLDDSTLPTSKLRLMCSYGGHIMTRPHDKSLCYIGGDTRIVVLDRRTTLSDFTDRLSKNLRHSQTFIIKYQLPNEDLDSLISISTDEDLENMIDEYDRLVSTKNKSSRLRIFLFPVKPDSVSSIGSLIGNSTKFSDSLLSFDDDILLSPTLNSSVDPANAKGVVNSTHAISEAFVAEMMSSSSSGSASSSPAIATLPAVHAHSEDQLVQMSSVVATAPMSYAPVTGDQKQTEYVKQTSTFDLLSPDSVSSDGSITNPLSRQKAIIYQDPILQISSPQITRSSSNPIEPNITDSNTSTRIVQMQDYGYLLPPQFQQQQQFIQAPGTQYIPNRPTASYYPIYPPNQHPIHQYNPSTMYYMPAKQPQPYNEATEVGSVPYTTASTGTQQYVVRNYAQDFGEPMQPQLYYNRGLEPQFGSHQSKEQNVKNQPIRTTSQP